MTRVRADKRHRVTRRADVGRVFRTGRRLADGLVTLLAARNGLDRTRVGVAVAKRHGNAARRNRIKRLCREAFRPIRAELPAGWDFMIVPRAGREFSLAALNASLRSLSRRLLAAGEAGES